MLAQRSLLFVMLLTVFFIGSVEARMPDTSLEDLVGESELIVIGDVVKVVEEAKDMNFESCGTATVRVERTLKGVTGARNIDVIYVPCVKADSAEYHACDKSILFLSGANKIFHTARLYRNEPGKYVTVRGYFGKIDVARGPNMVREIYLKGEERFQELDDFVKKIKALIDQPKAPKAQAEK